MKYNVQFPQALQKNQEVEFAIEKVLVDEELTIQHYFGRRVLTPTNYLLLEVLIPEDLAPKQAICYHYAYNSEGAEERFSRSSGRPVSSVGRSGSPFRSRVG